MTAIPTDARRRFDSGRVVRRMFGAMGSNFLLFAAFCAIFTGVPMALAESAYDSDAATASHFLAGYTPGYWVGYAAYLIASCVPQAVLAHGVAMHMNGRAATLSESAAAAVRSFLPLLGILLLGTAATTLGLALLIAPGLFLMTIWATAPAAQVVERTGVLEAFTRSRALTRGYAWHVFLFLLLSWALVYLIEAGAYAVSWVIIDLEWLSARWAGLVTTVIATTLEDLILIAAGAAIYFELRSLKEGADAPDLAAEFD